jgi:dTDP-4-amino-4,6-dideoxygalactose transaminase
MSLRKRTSLPEPLNSRSPKWSVPLAETCFSEDEVRSVADCIRSGWWTNGPVTRALEQDWKEYLNVHHAVAVSSGTAALHLAFHALGLGQGDEVVIPSLNFVAAANTALHFGAIPRFADVKSVSIPLVSEETIRTAINEHTRGIVVMHYGGYPCAMDAIVQLARKHGLWIVEDAAHAPGASFNGIPCGTWGDVACFSFFGNKNISCGEGGLIVTGRDDVARKLLKLRSHGMSTLTWDRFRGHSFSYDVTVAGFNFRMDDIRSALLRIQLRSLGAFNDLRRERVAWYRGLLGADSRWIIPFAESDEKSACHLFAVVLEKDVSRDTVMSFMKSKRIQTSIHYPPIHQMSHYRKMNISQNPLPITEDLGRRILTLPLFPGMTYEQVELVCSSFHEAVNEACRHVATRKMA